MRVTKQILTNLQKNQVSKNIQNIKNAAQYSIYTRRNWNTDKINQLLTKNHHMKRNYATTLSQENVGDEILHQPHYNIPKQLSKAPETKVTYLDNGFRVVSEARAGETAAVGVFIGSGSRQENVYNNGVAHFLEHMYFKGTQKRSKTDIEDEYEKNGAHLNAHTTREYTAFTSHCLKSDINRSISSLSDILLNSRLDSQDINEERQVILREMQEVEQSIEECVYDELHRTAFPDSGLGMSILGPEESVKRLRREHMIRYQQDFYTADRMILVGTGSIDHNELVNIAEQNFGHLQMGQFGANPQPLAEYQETPMYVGSDTRVDNQDIQGLHGAIAFQGPGLSSGDILCINLMQFIIGAYDISQGAPGKYAAANMAQYIGDEGLAKQIVPFIHGYSDTSLFGIKFISDGGNTTDSLQVEILHQMSRLCYKVTNQELERAKNLLKISLLSQYDGNLAGVLEEVGRQILLYNRRPSAAEMFARVDAITADDIKRVASKYIYDQDPVIVGIGHTKEMIDYSWAKLYTYSWRV